jgi:ADP-heptose:LPS heptosyltransferase/SAM-dependent methyltransferase
MLEIDELGAIDVLLRSGAVTDAPLLIGLVALEGQRAVLESQQSKISSGGDFDPLRDKRAQIDTTQFLSLSRMIPRPTASLPVRVAMRLQENFFGQPLRQKLRFTRYALRWCFAQLHGRYVARPKTPARVQSLGQVPTKTLRVAIHGTGSIGDFLTHMLFIQSFYKTYGPMEIDLFCHQKKIAEAKFIFAKTPFIKNVITVNVLNELKSNYDLIVYLRYLVKYEIVDHSRILSANPELFNVIEIAKKRFEPYDYVFQQHPCLDGLFARHVGLQRMNLADVTGYLGNIDVNRDSIPYFVPDISESGATIKFGLEGKDYITIHYGFDTSYIPLAAPVTKCWPLAHWRDFVRLFKARFPDIMVVQIGAYHSDRIEGVDLVLVNKTTFDEAAWLIKHSLLHIDGESGLVRMARALHTTSTVMFGPTSSSFFSFGRNINIVSKVCNDCWWATQDWMSACPRGLKVPECMDSIKPNQVLDAVADYLTGLGPTKAELVSAALYGPTGGGDRHAAAAAGAVNPLQVSLAPAAEHFAGGERGAASTSARHWQTTAALDALEKIRGEDSAPLNIADVGSSRGALPAYLAKDGHRVTVIERGFAADGPEIERQLLKSWAAHKVGVEFGSPLNIPAENETFDVVFLLSALDDVPHKIFALREAIRALKSGGHLIFTSVLEAERGADRPGRKPTRDRWTPERLQSCLADLGIEFAGFSAAEVESSRRQVERDGVRDISPGATLATIVVKKL